MNFYWEICAIKSNFPHLHPWFQINQWIPHTAVQHTHDPEGSLHAQPVLHRPPDHHKMAKEHLQPTTTETSPSKQWKSHPWTINTSMRTQMLWFRENWYEEVLRQLKQGLAKCHAVAFENRGAGESSSLDEAGVLVMFHFSVADATITPTPWTLSKSW